MTDYEDYENTVCKGCGGSFGLIYDNGEYWCPECLTDQVYKAESRMYEFHI